MSRRSLSSARDIKGIDQVLKERLEAPRPAFTTLHHRRSNATTVHMPSYGPSKTQGRSHSQSSAARGDASSKFTNSHAAVAIPRTPVPVSNAVANGNLALLVARDITRQPDRTTTIKQLRTEDKAKVSIGRRYNMVVDEIDIITSPLAPVGDSDSARRLVRPVAKGGLRSEYYIPNRKHTMTELRQSTSVSKNKVSAFTREAPGTINFDSAKTIVDFIGKASKALGTVALVNKMFASAVDVKLTEEDLNNVATNDEYLRMLKRARSEVNAIPLAFFNAIRTLRTDPPAKVMTALRLVVLVLEGDVALVENVNFDGVAATFAFRSRMERGTEQFKHQLASLDPASVPKEVVDCIRSSNPNLDDLAIHISEYNPHAGTLVRWVNTMLAAN